MTAGMETITPDGRGQLTTDMVFFRLEQTVQLPAGSGWSQYGNNSGQRDVFIAGLTIADAPMPALTSAGGSWAEIVSTSGGGITYRVYSVGPSDVTLLVFSQRRPPVSAHMAGCELYKPDGSIVFSSDYPIARPLGILSNTGYSGVSLAGRSVAHVPQKQEANSAVNYTYTGQGSCQIGPYQGYQVYQRNQWSRTSVVASGSTAAAGGNFYSDSGTIQYMCASSPSGVPLSQQIGSLGGWRSLILDITNL
ncbi:hypothetical protein NTCA1_10920 [Novosphingobium sp. TCA1]|nr:hypothetical protein NTCA1_10920 [Novosphingobium sp. TCA1]